MVDLLREDPSADGVLFFDYLLQYAKKNCLPVMTSVCEANPMLNVAFRMIVCTYVWHIGLGESPLLCLPYIV